tara:strand:- start:413 stop:2080 length:1668 start_codon:yes stop_codon:yes gene_type:complete
MKLIECVPNFSEGRNQDILNQISNSIKNVRGVTLLDFDQGKDTNRTVVTFVGDPDSVIEAAFNAIKIASKLIDMRLHEGEHPRMGSTDVCPLIPVANVTMDECIEYSKKLSKLVAANLNIPIFLYENSSNIKSRKSLSNIRSGEYEGMSDKLKNKNWKPDYGKAELNLQSGVTAIGAREFLIAYNINLNTQDRKLATDIALDIRESGRAKRDSNGTILRDQNDKIIKVPGKLKYCKAVGWYIEEYNLAQVSINLTNYKKNSMHKTFEEVRKQARKRGLRVTGSEVVGLLPKKSLLDAGYYYLKKQKKSTGIPDNDIIDIAISSLGLNDISKFDKNKKIIENVINHNELTFSNNSLRDFLDEISRETPTPGGGSVSALSASLGAALSSMVANLSYAKKGFENNRNMHIERSSICQKLLKESLLLVDKDSQSYDDVIRALRLPKRNKIELKTRKKALYDATKAAAISPLNILKLCNKIIEQTFKITVNGNLNSISDGAVANDMILASAKGAIYNIHINIKDLDESDQKKFKNEIDYYYKQIKDFNLKINNYVEKHLF